MNKSQEEFYVQHSNEAEQLKEFNPEDDKDLKEGGEDKRSSTNSEESEKMSIEYQAEMQAKIIEAVKAGNYDMAQELILRLKEFLNNERKDMPLESELKPRKNGEVILHLEKWPDFYAWVPHPDGIIFEKDRGFFLNVNGDEKPLFEGAFNGYTRDPGGRGIFITRGDEILLNGQELVYEGEYDFWMPTSEGVVIKKGNQLLLNGKELLYEGKGSSYMPHPRGVLVIQGGNRILLNGKELLYEGPYSRIWSHPQGVVIQKDNQILLNGKKLLYSGAWHRIESVSNGIIIEADNKLLLDGKKLLYEHKEKDVKWDWQPQGNGVVVYKNDGKNYDWTFYDGNIES